MTEHEKYQEHIRHTHDAFCKIVIRHAQEGASLSSPGLPHDDGRGENAGIPLCFHLLQPVPRLHVEPGRTASGGLSHLRLRLRRLTVQNILRVFTL